MRISVTKDALIFALWKTSIFHPSLREGTVYNKVMISTDVHVASTIESLSPHGTQELKRYADSRVVHSGFP